MTDEQVHYNQRKMLAKRKLTEIGMPKRIAGPIAWYSKEDSLWRAIDDDFGKWSADVLAGNYDADLLSLHQFGEKNLADLKDFLRQSPRAPAPLCIQPGPASKVDAADKTIKAREISVLLEDRPDPGYLLWRVKTKTGHVGNVDRAQWSFHVIAHDFGEAAAIAQDLIKIYVGTPDECSIDSIKVIDNGGGGIFFDASGLKSYPKPQQG